MNYRLYYNYKTNGDILFLVIDPLAYPDEVKEKDDVVCLYSKGELIGINFLSIGKKVKIHAEGMIVNPLDEVIDILNNVLKNASFDIVLPYVRNSFYKIARIEKKEEHPLNERMSILTLNLGDKTLSTVTRYQNVNEGDKVLVALDNCLRYDGSIFKARVERNIPIECELCSEKDVRLGEESKAALIIDKGNPGEDFFI